MKNCNGDEIIELDQKKLTRMEWGIFTLERENAKTGKRSEREMKQKIQDIIEEEVNKCY